MKKSLVAFVSVAVILSQSLITPALAQALPMDTGTGNTNLLATLADTLAAIQGIINQISQILKNLSKTQGGQGGISAPGAGVPQGGGQGTQAPTYPYRAPETVPGELLIKFKDAVSPQDQTDQLSKWGFKVKSEIAQIKVKQISVPIDAEDALAEALSHNPKIQFAEVNKVVAPSLIPNDPYYPNQWHLLRINGPVAWDITTGNANTVIAILDTGVSPTPPDLAAKLVPGYNFWDNNTDTSDPYGHGTAVAGTAGAISNNSIGVASVAWQNKIMPIRVAGLTSNGFVGATLVTMSNGLIWAADHGAKVANMSICNVTGVATLDSAANYFRSKGGLVVVSASNTANYISTPNDPYMISVSATSWTSGYADITDTFAGYSSYGPFVDVSAPGTYVYTTLKDGTYAGVSGTSFSSPIVAGVLGLIFSINPSLTPSQAENILETTATDIGTPGWDQYFGWGRVDAGKAVALAKSTVGTTPPPPPADTTAPTASITSPLSGSTLSGIVNVSVSASDNVGVTRVELWKDGTLYSSDTSSPYSFAWDTTKDINGTHTLQAKAYDTAGNVGTSASIGVNVSNAGPTPDTTPPTVSITSPLNGSVLPQPKATISASGSDNVGVYEIDLYFDSVLRNSCFNTTFCSTNVNVKRISSGTHTITAKASDASGNTGTATITVTK